MTWDFAFTLPARPGAPTSYPAAGAHCSRHHIVGRKYIQLLQSLSQLAGVADGTLKRFAGWPTSGTAPAEGQFATLFFWSPYNLFIGPEGTRRAFNPSSGVEMTRPASFPLDRWNALKAIAPYLESQGVKLAELASLADNATKTWKIKDEKATVATNLTRLIKAVTDTVKASKVPIHSVDHADWAIVTELSIKNKKVNSYAAVTSLYGTCKAEHLLLTDVPFDTALANDAYRFLLIPSN